MSKLAKVDRFFKNVNLTSDDEVFVGVDVHKKSYHVALFLNDTPAIDFRMAAEPKQLNKKLEPMACSIKDIVYETGPTGYGLARDLRKNKLPANVVATSKTPRPAGTDDKTDRLDSKKLAEYSAKGLLRPVAIPTPTTPVFAEISGAAIVAEIESAAPVDFGVVTHCCTTIVGVTLVKYNGNYKYDGTVLYSARVK